MPDPISIRLQGRDALQVLVDDEELQALLQRLERKTGDLRDFFLRRLDPLVTKAFVEQFESEGQFLGGRSWRGIASLTEQLRARPGHGFAGPRAILRDTDGMRRSLVHATNEGYRRVDRTEYERGILSSVAALHQTGWTSKSIFGRRRRQPVKVPARPIVPETIPRSIIMQWVEAAVKYLEE